MVNFSNRRKNKVEKDKGQTIVFIIYFILFIIFSLLFIYPMFWCFQNSFKSVEEYYENPSALPIVWNFSYYIEIFRSFEIDSSGFWEMTWNSVYLTFGGQFLNILASACVAYPLARYNFPFKKFLYGIIIFRITIPIIGASAASYKLIRALGMVNNPLTFIITFFNGFDLNALILYGYFKGISKEYSEAAFIDGANRIRTLVSVVLPQAMPCILALYVSSVMGYWNVYTTSQIYLPKYPNLALGIFEFENTMRYIENGSAKFFGAIILSSLVPIVLFGISQKTMLKNMSVGGLKG